MTFLLLSFGSDVNLPAGRYLYAVSCVWTRHGIREFTSLYLAVTAQW